ncbi:MAG: hypothetical protein U1E70_20000 [Acetobacteraceae bacterium]
MAGTESSQAQLDRMRAEIDQLTRQPPALAQFTNRAEAAVGTAGEQVQARTQVVAGAIRQRPFAAVGIMVGAGWLVGRALHRRRRRLARAARNRRVR